MLLGVAVAHAEPREFKREYEAGIDAFRLGKYTEARAHLERAHTIDPKLPGPQRFLAAVAQAEQRWQDCIDAARAAIALNPASSEIADTRKVHDACREAAGKPPYRAPLDNGAAIALVSNVPGATVKINGLTYGGTPLAPRPIASGKLTIEVSKLGWHPAHAEADALPGIVTDVAVELAPDPGTVDDVTSHPKTTPRPTTTPPPAGCCGSGATLSTSVFAAVFVGGTLRRRRTRRDTHRTQT